jgi:hypothetical protein
MRRIGDELLVELSLLREETSTPFFMAPGLEGSQRAAFSLIAIQSRAGG